MEAIGYCAIYFLKGYLPWQGIKALNKNEKNNRIADKKVLTCIENLCKGFPVEFSTYLNYCRCLSFESKPDYFYIRKLFMKLFLSQGYELDYMYDWCLEKNGKTTHEY